MQRHKESWRKRP